MSHVRTRFVKHPESDAIARRLTVEGAKVCAHDRNPCYLRCGVRRDVTGEWHAIPEAERLRWLREIEDAIAKSQPVRRIG